MRLGKLQFFSVPTLHMTLPVRLTPHQLYPPRLAVACQCLLCHPHLLIADAAGTNFFSGAESTTPGSAEPSPVDPASPMAPGKTMGQLHKFKTDTGDALLLECGFNKATRTSLGDLAVKYKRRIPASFGECAVGAHVSRVCSMQV